MLDEAQRIMVIIQRSLGLLDKELDEYQMKQQMLVPQYHESFMFLFAYLFYNYGFETLHDLGFKSAKQIKVMSSFVPFFVACSISFVHLYCLVL